MMELNEVLTDECIHVTSHNPDITHFHCSKKFLHSFLGPASLHFESQAIAGPFSFTILPVLGFHMEGVTQYVLFCVWCLCSSMFL